MSVSRYESYKDSGVEWLGEVPSHWNVLPCRAIVDERNTRNDGGAIQAYLSLMANVGIIPYEEKGDIGNKKPDDLEKCKLVFRGDLVINSMNYGIGSYGLSDLEGVCSPVYIVLIPKLSVVEQRFVFRILQNRAFQTLAQSFGNGILAHRAAINWDILKVIKVAVPPKPEQLQILNFLDRETTKIDDLINEQTRLIELLKEKRQAVISHAVTKGLNPDAPMKDSGVEWLGEVPEHWEVVPVGYKYEVQLGRMLNEERSSGDHLRPYLRVFDVQWGAINTEALPLMDFPPDAQHRYRLQLGDLLVNEGGSYVGRSAIWKADIEECYYQKALHRLRAHVTSNDTAEFFLHVMEMATKRGVFIAGGNQTTIDHLTADQLRSYRFAFPPIAEQRQIASFLMCESRKLELLENEAQSAVTLLQERRSALISAAVTGKIDVRGLVGAEAEAA